MFPFTKNRLAKFNGILLLAFALMLVGCDQNEAKDGPNKEPELAVSITRDLTAITATPASFSTEEPLLPQETPSSPTPSPTREPDELFSSDTARCGNLLPILPDVGHPVNDLGVIAIPEALVPDAALPALSRLLEEPATVGLAAFEVGRESEGLFLNAEEPMPLASVVKVLDLVAYAEAVEAGKIDPRSYQKIQRTK